MKNSFSNSINVSKSFGPDQANYSDRPKLLSKLFAKVISREEVLSSR